MTPSFISQIKKFNSINPVLELLIKNNEYLIKNNFS